MSKLKSNKYRLIAAAISGIACIAVCILMFYLNSDVFKNSPFKESKDSSKDYVKIIDVGQGDCILIVSNEYSALIDTGIGKSANDVCAEIEEAGIEKLDVMLITHLHDDHTGGIERITEIYKVDNLILPSISIESDELGHAELAINRVTQSGGNVCQAVQGMNFNLGDFEITILASFEDMADENNRSLIVAAEIREKRFLFTGDAEEKAEKALIKENLNLKCDVLKIGHHGSNSSSCEEFLEAVSPKIAAISVGEGNMYGHPHNMVLERLEKMGVSVYRTDLSGDIVFYVNEKSISCKTER